MIYVEIHGGSLFIINLRRNSVIRHSVEYQLRSFAKIFNNAKAFIFVLFRKILITHFYESLAIDLMNFSDVYVPVNIMLHCRRLC
jgi:hypothetical protein